MLLINFVLTVVFYSFVLKLWIVESKLINSLQVHRFAVLVDTKIPIQKTCLSENGFALTVEHIMTEI